MESTKGERAGDYTDGGGWAKLDARSARELSRIMRGFSRYRNDYESALLALFSSLESDGTTRIGIRTLADKSGVTVNKARGLVRRLEESGDLVRVSEERTPSGKVTRRAFSWTAPGAGKAEGEDGCRIQEASPAAPKMPEDGAWWTTSRS